MSAPEPLHVPPPGDADAGPGAPRSPGAEGTTREEVVKARLLRIATAASVTAALVLVAAKAAAWAMTGSVSVLSTLIDSLMDVGASMINLIAVRNALKPADTQHRFGHGKAEPLAGLGQSAFVAGSSVFLVIEAVDRLVSPSPVVNESIGIAVMGFAIVVTLLLVSFQSYVVRRTRSLAISADSLHYKGDVMIHASVILSLVLDSEFGLGYLDPVFGIGIAVYLVATSWQIAHKALDSLMDRELEEVDRERIIDIALAHPEVKDIHDLRTRSAGPRSFIQFHLDLGHDISLVHAHEISDEVEAEVRAAFPGSGVIIHQDPEGIVEHRATFTDQD